MKTNFKLAANQFKEAVLASGFSYSIRGSILTVSKTFNPGSEVDFVKCDLIGPHLLSLAPSTTVGSVWGTDGGSVGGFFALQRGMYILNKSGVSKKFLKALTSNHDPHHI